MEAKGKFHKGIVAHLGISGQKLRDQAKLARPC